ncbi:MAG: M14 family zinc carboxypeptidase, partial [Candidatus Aminicenantales bacterium]
GGLDINRNWPAQWQQEYIQYGAGPYPLSEPETRAVAEFLLSHPNITGVVNHHMAGNFLYRPPTNRHFKPITGEEEEMPPEDEAYFRELGNAYSRIINNQPVRKVLGRGGPPRRGAIWGVMIGWAYDHYGVFSFVPEMGSYVPFCDYDKNKRVSEKELLRWNDEKLGGKIFKTWKKFSHPQLGEVEIGGFIRKLYNPKFKSYTNLMCYPSPAFEDFLEKHTRWNLELVSRSPLVRIRDIRVEHLEGGYVKLSADIQNQGFLPTHITQQAIKNQTAKTVKVNLTLKEAELVIGKQRVDLGHLPGHTSLSPSPLKTVEWMVKPRPGSRATAVIRVVSEKGGTHTRHVSLENQARVTSW